MPAPSGSPSEPKVAVKGSPSLAWKIPPSCHPSASQCAAAKEDFGDGRFHVPFKTSTRPMLKSDNARLRLESKYGRVDTEFENASGARLEEVSSMLLLHV